MSEVNDPLFRRPSVAGVRDIDQDALRSTVQVIASRNAPGQFMKQGAAPCSEAHSLLVHDQFLMPKWLRHGRNSFRSTLQRALTRLA